jgi:hypothetical protein
VKAIVTLMLLLSSLSVYAWNEEYNFSDLTRIDDFDFSSEVLDHDGYTLLVFNNGRCSISSSPVRCFPYEAKLNKLAPAIKGRNKNLNLVIMDVESSYTYRDYNITKFPSAVLLYQGSQLSEKLEANRCHYGRSMTSEDRINCMNWANVLLQKTLDEIYKIPADF